MDVIQPDGPALIGMTVVQWRTATSEVWSGRRQIKGTCDQRRESYRAPAGHVAEATPTTAVIARGGAGRAARVISITIIHAQRFSVSSKPRRRSREISTEPDRQVSDTYINSADGI